MSLDGQCNCGAIKVTVPKDVSNALCHCISCRRLSGATASGNLIVEVEKFHLIGKPSEWSYTGNSGHEASVAFCGTCGSGIWTKTHNKKFVFVKIGLFPPGTVPAPTLELFTKNLESWEKVHDGAQDVREQLG